MMVFPLFVLQSGAVCSQHAAGWDNREHLCGVSRLRRRKHQGGHQCDEPSNQVLEAGVHVREPQQSK